MSLRIAFAGFRHGHILDLYKLALQRDGLSVVAAAEEHGPTREQLQSAGKVRFTHSSYDQLLAGVEFDILATGDAYGRRGPLLIRALQAGKHVIADKPIATTLEQLGRIAELSRSRKLAVGCQLTMRDLAQFRTLREVVRSGRIGPVQTITFTGQHPLLRNSRASWYFESLAMHGGTINDIAIHGIDAVGWLTGRRIVEIVSARVWNGGLTQPDWFQVGAQLMLRLDNGGGVLGDVSYLAPSECGYQTNNYWRFTLHGADGQAETAVNDDAVTLYTAAGKSAERIPLGPAAPGGHFESFLAEIAGAAGQRDERALSTAEVLQSSRICLLAQAAAEENRCHVPCTS